MSAYDFDCDPTDAESLASWSVLGIEMREPAGDFLYWMSDGELYKEIGAIAVHDDGLIRLLPFEGLHPAELDFLRGAAMEAFRNKPRKSTGWTRRQRKGARYWWCAVSLQVSPDDPVARAIRAAESRNSNLDLVLRLADAATTEVQ
ncbi:hypothetical protein M2284_002628 [Rhodococcus sp. LBL1]|nr:hypothetical protein [Rhodococcus sp. LBL1]MDH6684012.1 hypothetical protein [Rhodococcus sp. LBL2]